MGLGCLAGIAREVRMKQKIQAAAKAQARGVLVAVGKGTATLAGLVEGGCVVTAVVMTTTDHWLHRQEPP